MKGRRLRQLPRWAAPAALGLVLIAVALLLLLDPGATEPGPPHPFLSDLSASPPGAPDEGAKAPCDAARDSRGYIYVSSGSAVSVFDPHGEHLAAIQGSQRPCELAVDPEGNVYVSESRNGDVVKYAPHEYPFEGVPTYGAPVAIDASGRARDIAIDPYDERLYVAEGDRVSSYDSDGTLGEDEVQRVLPYAASGGTFSLSFRGKKTVPLPYDATHEEVEAALAGLPTIGPGNVAVREGPNGKGDHLVRFRGALGSRDVEMLRSDDSHLIGSRVKNVFIRQYVEGFDGRIGEGALKDATGVAAYIRVGVERAPPSLASAARAGPENRFASLAGPGGGGDPLGHGAGETTLVSHEIPALRGLTHYVFVADRAGAAPDRVVILAGDDIRSLRPLPPIDGSQTPAGSIGFDRSGAVLGVDPKDGHLFAYDAGHEVVDEFEASGPYVSQIEHERFGGETPAGIAVERSGGSSDGTVHVTTSGADGASVLAFGPLPPPKREPVAHLSLGIRDTCDLTVDSHGDVYASLRSTIGVFSPQGNEIGRIPEPRHPCNLAVDSVGTVYASVLGGPTEGDEEVVVFAPDSFPPTAATTYSAPKTLLVNEGSPKIAVNPRDDRLIARTGELALSEFRSAREGNELITEEFASGKVTGIEDIDGRVDVCARGGYVYVVGRAPSGDVEGGWRVYVLARGGTEALTTITGSGSPRGVFTEPIPSIAVDQSNCHVFVEALERSVEEYEASGAFVTELGPAGVAIGVDNGSHSPNRGDVYVTSGDGLTAFGSLSYEAE